MVAENVRPWGKYDVVAKTKIITVKPNQILSLQFHEGRDEYWRILSGSGEVQIGEKNYPTKPGDEFRIRRQEIHRVKSGDEGLVFLEVQTGQVDENDIVRIKDKYGRAKNNG